MHFPSENGYRSQGKYHSLKPMILFFLAGVVRLEREVNLALYNFGFSFIPGFLSFSQRGLFITFV